MRGRLVSVLLELRSSPLFHHARPGGARGGHQACYAGRRGRAIATVSEALLRSSSPGAWSGQGCLTTRVFYRPMKYSVCLPRGDWSGSGSSSCLTRESSKPASCLPCNALFFVPPRDDHPSRNGVVPWRNDRWINLPMSSLMVFYGCYYCMYCVHIIFVSIYI